MGAGSTSSLSTAAHSGNARGCPKYSLDTRVARGPPRSLCPECNGMLAVHIQTGGTV